MKQSLQNIQLLLIRLSIPLLAYLISKIIFFLYNYSHFHDVSFFKYISILFYGLQFDISAMVLINSPFILLHIVPFQFTKHKWYQVLLITVFVIANSMAILADSIDIAYYQYSMRRTTADIFDLFSLGSDIPAMLPQYIKDFWYILILWSILTALIWWLYNKTQTLHKGEKQNTKIVFSPFRVGGWFALHALLIGLMIIGFRGGLQLRPIMPINASEYVAAKNIPLIINTPFSIIKSFDLEKLEEKPYFPDEKLYSVFNPIHKKQERDTTEEKSNIFIIIMESFSHEYIGALSGNKTHTPFLDSLIKESLVFENAFANGKKSIEGIPAILAGIPALSNESYITSAYGSNQFTSIANTLKKIGYSSAFFHGGTKGTMGFDAFCSAAGFDQYHGRSEYNNEKDYDGNWGIWDEEFFQYTNEKVSKMKSPFLAVLFSLSSHHPFSIPEKYKDKFQGGNLAIHKSVEYADFSLKRFFETASKEKWFDNTLFIITADHTGPSNDPYYSSNAGIFKVPLLFYKPNRALKGANPAWRQARHPVAQHTDIMPSVLHYINYNEDFFSFGNNLFDDLDNRYAVNFTNGVYQIFQDDFLLQFDGESSLGFFNYKTDSLFQTNLLGNNIPLEKEMEEKLKAIIQVYHHGMINNKMTVENFR